MRIGAMILAAGKDRVGDLPKATIELSGTTVIKREINLLREAEISPIVIVAGKMADELEKHIAHRKVPILKIDGNKNSDMLMSVKKGLESMIGHCDKAVVLPVDIPAFLPETLIQLAGATYDSKYDLTIPTYEGKEGHPVLLHMAAAPKILGYQENGGLQGMIEAGQLRPLYVEVADPGIAIELNHPQDPEVVLDYDNAVRNATPIRPIIRISLERTKEFLTQEFVIFLKTVDATGSMNGACQKMGIAYSRAWTMINQGEIQLGVPLIERLTGGKGGGSSVLTAEARGIITKYEVYSEKLLAEAEKLYKDIFE